MLKKATTAYAVSETIKNRWSPRSFSAQPLTETDLNTLIEAATWAPSANNEQPWLFVTALKGSPAFDAVWSCLMAGNQPWAQNAGGFIVAVARTTFAANGNANPWAEHDLGLATGFLMLQATEMGLYTHPMAGYDRTKLNETLAIGEGLKALCVLAVGYLGEAEALEEPFKTRELTPRSRKSVEEVLLAKETV